MLSSIKTNNRKKEFADGGKLLFIWQAHYVLEYFLLKEKNTESDASEGNMSYLLSLFCAWAELTVLLK